MRLATDPDPTDEKRGVSGYTFALPGEPDLDRIVRLHDPVALRSHAPQVGVRVSGVDVHGTRDLAHPLLGAPVLLLHDPRFEMRNYVLTNQYAGTEAIDPFEIEVRAGDVTIRRRDVLDPEHPRLPIWKVPLAMLQRRGGALGNAQKTFERVTGLKEPRAYRARRLAALQKDLELSTDPVERAGLAKRVHEIESYPPSDRRTVSLTFEETRRFDVNGPATVHDPRHALGPLDLAQPWPIRFTNAVWDCDALCGWMEGRLVIPRPGERAPSEERKE